MPTESNQDIRQSKWALVTGASAGIGEEFCQQLAKLGYNLVLVARRKERLQALANKLENRQGTTCLIIPADLSIHGAASAIARQLIEEEIDVEFLVNNAGYGVPGRFIDSSWQTHEDFIQVMMTSVCELTWHLIPAMQSRKKGYVINVASVAGLVPPTESHTLYGASKAFVIPFSEALALENIYHGVNVSALCPGFTYSEFHDVTQTREIANKLPKFIWLSAEEVVRYGIESVTRSKPRIIAIPGLFYRMIVAMIRYIPGLGRWTNRKMSRRFRKLD